MKVRFIPRVQRSLYHRGVHGALDVWTVRGKTAAGRYVLQPHSQPRKRKASLLFEVLFEVEPDLVVAEP